MNKMLGPLGILILGVGFAILLVHGFQVLRVQRGLAELTSLRRSMLEGASSQTEALRQQEEYIKIREQYRERGISHPHYEEAFRKSPVYYSVGLAFLVIGAVIWRVSHKSRRKNTHVDSDEPQSPDGNQPESSE